LPVGVGASVAANDCPKVFIPNTGRDPEQFGTTLTKRFDLLVEYLRRDAGSHVPIDRLVNVIILDSRNGEYDGDVNLVELNGRGVQIIDAPLVAESSRPFLDPERLLAVLLSLT
jgi:hypothetical protein